MNARPAADAFASNPWAPPVDVIAPVIVAALVNGNDIVFVIHAVSDDATRQWEQPIAQACSTSRSSMSTSARLSSSP